MILRERLIDNLEVVYYDRIKKNLINMVVDVILVVKSLNLKNFMY